ncbi:hypothetical protein GGU10DRAFT_436718 [Lentinula aff. detonsa]|uniref:BZIP domain-containing protein n=1 Tax=Lentinula aff. detonsa TaxID=2804958 RepID=A0AA38NHY9_9AGAR|nr:hypothetical protein GGU10DRAFT_436718 [Lentinula aff. detonsa]
MLSLEGLEHSHDNDSVSDLLNPNIDSELEHWQKLVFSFDMDGGDNNDNSSFSGSTNPDGRNARSRSHSVNQQGSNAPVLPRNDVQDAILLAQFAAGNVLPQPQTTQDPSYNALLLALLQAQNSQHGAPNFQSSAINQHLYGQQSISQSNLNLASIPNQFQWPPNFGHQQQNFLFNQPGMPAHITGYPHLPQINTNVALGASGGSAAASSSPPTAVSRASSPADPADLGITEDKRRRNTAASARFRIKKKQRNLNLERTVSDLSGRADDLEKEAADLRRENGWLKEIVMLKGSRLAGLDVSPQNLPRPPEGNASFWGPTPTNSGSSQPVASSSKKSNERSQDSESEPESGDDSDGYNEGSIQGGAASSKGKERQK